MVRINGIKNSRLCRAVNERDMVIYKYDKRKSLDTKYESKDKEGRIKMIQEEEEFNFFEENVEYNKRRPEIYVVQKTMQCLEENGIENRQYLKEIRTGYIKQDRPG